MSINPVVDTLGRRLRIGMIGGGPKSFIGGVHQTAIRMDARYDLVTGVFSSDPEKSRSVAVSNGVAPDRIYESVDEMYRKEADRVDGMDVVTIVTPNDSHYPYAMAALEAGYDVFCDKPMTNTLEEARNLHQKVEESGLVFCLTHNYTGYPMVRQARAMIQAGELGDVRMVQVEYVQGGKAKPLVQQPGAKKPWRFDASRGGPSVVLGDIGTHAHNLVRYMTGAEISEVAAEVGTIVPDRDIDDFGGALLHFANGARGVFWVTQAAAGMENCLKVRISGSLGTVEWWQEFPQRLTYRPLEEPYREFTPNGVGTNELCKRACRIVRGHPEGFIEAFANLYRDAGEAIAARKTGTKADPLAMTFPNSRDGLKGVEFVAAAMESSNNGGRWVKVGG